MNTEKVEQINQTLQNKFMKPDLTSACHSFLTDGYVPKELLVAYDQNGAKIPAMQMPIWEPDEFVQDMAGIPEGEIWEDILPTLDGPPRLHDQLPDKIDMDRLTQTEPDGKVTFFGTIFSEGADPVEITYHHIQGDIIAPETSSVSAKNLETIQGDIYALVAKNCDLRSLREARDILIYSAEKVRIESIETVGNLEIPMWEGGEFPNLREAGEISIPSSDEVEMPKLEKCDGIMALGSKKASFPSLTHVENDLDLGYAETIVAPKLQEVGGNLYSATAPEFSPESLKVGGDWDRWEPQEIPKKKGKKIVADPEMT